MSTLASADLGSDSDPEDGDFRPTLPKSKSKSGRHAKANERKTYTESESDDGSSDESTSSEDDDGGNGNTLAGDVKEGDEAERRRKAQEAFKALQEEVEVIGSERSSGKDAAREVEMVEVKRARRFAGETI
jgi:hypothetical protein